MSPHVVARTARRSARRAATLRRDHVALTEVAPEPRKPLASSRAVRRYVRRHLAPEMLAA